MCNEFDERRTTYVMRDSDLIRSKSSFEKVLCDNVNLVATVSPAPYDIYPCNNIDLLLHWPLEDMQVLEDNWDLGGANDIWGWTHPTGDEYALLGSKAGISIVNITTNEYVAFITHNISDTIFDCGNGWCTTNEIDNCPQDCADDVDIPTCPNDRIHIPDCADAHCCLVAWIGDGIPDCPDQLGPYPAQMLGCDLSCLRFG